MHECHILTMRKEEFAIYENKPKGLQAWVRGGLKGLYESTVNQWGTGREKFDVY